MVCESNWFVITFCAYFIGGFLNHSMTLACHELSHDLWFPKRWMNIWYGYFMNCCLGVAFFRTFKRYHLEHHSFQGDHEMDVDIATVTESIVPFSCNEYSQPRSIRLIL